MIMFRVKKRTVQSSEGESTMGLMRGLFLGLFVILSVTNPWLAEGSPSAINVDVQEFRLKNDMLFLVVEHVFLNQSPNLLSLPY